MTLDLTHMKVFDAFQSKKKLAESFYGRLDCDLDLDPVNFKNSKLLGYTEKSQKGCKIYLNLKAAPHPDFQKVIAHEMAHAVCMLKDCCKGHDDDFKSICGRLGGFIDQVIDNGFGGLVEPSETFRLWSVKSKPVFVFPDEHQQILRLDVKTRKRLGLVYENRSIIC